MTQPSSPVTIALGGLCPRCGARTLFAGPVRFSERCSACRLDFATFNVGDGPAAFLILVLGGIITAAAIVFELAVGPPWWAHVLLWLPLTTGAVLFALRVSKAMLLALEYRNAAREARIVPAPDEGP